MRGEYVEDGLAVRDAVFRDDGVLAVTVGGSISQEALDYVAKTWDSSTIKPLTFTRDYMVEILIDNTEGQALLALDPDFEYETLGEEKSVEDDSPTGELMTKEEIVNLLTHAAIGRVSLDIVSQNSVAAGFFFQSPYEEGAIAIEEVLAGVVARFTSEVEEEGGQAEGSVERMGNEVRGDITIADFEQSFGDSTRDTFREYEERFEP